MRLVPTLPTLWAIFGEPENGVKVEYTQRSLALTVLLPEFIRVWPDKSSKRRMHISWHLTANSTSNYESIENEQGGRVNLECIRSNFSQTWRLLQAQVF